MTATGVARTRSALTLPRERTIGLMLAAGTAVISGFSVFVNATAVKAVPDPAVFTTLKNLVAVAVLLVVAAALVRPAEVRAIARNDRLLLAVIGVFGGGVAFLLFFSGLAMASAPTAAFIHKTLFVWVALLAVPFLGERLGAWQLGGLGLLLVAQLVVAPPTGVRWGGGEMLIAVATLLWAIEVVVAKRLLAAVPSSVAAAGRMGFGLVILLAYLAATGKVDAIVQLAPAAWAWVAVTGLLLTGYVATWYAALQRAPAAVVTSVLVVGAVVTASLQTLASGTLPRVELIGGYALIAATGAGIALVAGRTRRRPSAESVIAR